ncbi:hypothetical protein BVtw_03470 [Bartonella vinsonii subsp. berkhoffii str. Tweed]|uniref:Uncharacterized protein n=1 Tax=Bartonella vinsonii subsp. berkhoffii str. Tweed TaxID=1094502 RepID=N6USK9_BARVB|nr:hypothetical protein BVtw_03470 [Bartonella vinsonii subsp. berkhoffii str. Tweed]
MTKTKKLDMELPKEGRFISSEFPILRENLTKIDQAMMEVEEKVDQKAPSKHTHSISEVADLEAALKGKMAADKTFSFADLSDIEGAQDAANNYVLYKASNNHFTFGSAISLLGSHQHKTEDIIGLDEFRAKLNEDLTAYGRLKQANEWQNYNKFTSKVTMSDDLELIGNSSLNLMHNGEVVTSLSATGSKLKGPLKVDGAEVYSKNEALVALQEIRDEITKLRKATSPLEILMTQSGTIPFPEGVSDDTEIEIRAWVLVEEVVVEKEKANIQASTMEEEVKEVNVCMLKLKDGNLKNREQPKLVVAVKALMEIKRGLKVVIHLLMGLFALAVEVEDMAVAWVVLLPTELVLAVTVSRVLAAAAVVVIFLERMLVEELVVPVAMEQSC